MIKNIFDKFFVSLIGKILGFLKIIVLINYYGTSYFTDSLIIILSIYWFWSNIIVYSLFSVSLIPSLSSTTNNKGQISMTLRTLQSVNLISILGVILVFIFPNQIISIFAPIDDYEFKVVSVKLLYLMSPLLILIPFTEIFTILNYYKKRMKTASINLTVWNFLQLISILVAFHFFSNEIYLVYCFSIFTVFGYVVTGIIQLKSNNYFNNFNFRKLFNISIRNFIDILKKNYIFFLATLFSQLNLYVDNFFISSLQEGYISKYNIIIKIPEFLQSLLISSLSVVFFNKIVEKNVQEKKIFLQFILYLSPLILIAVFLSNFIGSDFLYFIYNKSSFVGLEKFELTGILNIISINVFFMISVSLLLKIYISKNLTNIILIATILNVVVNIMANYLLIKNYGIYGIAISTLISTYILNWILFSYYFRLNIIKNLILLIILLIILFFFFF